MVIFRTIWHMGLFVLLTLVLTGQARSQFPWQTPVQRDPAEVNRIVGPLGQREPSRDLNIVWVWGIDKLHEKETHEYAWVMDRYVNLLLPKVPRVTVTPSMYFPSKELWEKADLVVLHVQRSLLPDHPAARHGVDHEGILRTVQTAGDALSQAMI